MPNIFLKGWVTVLPSAQIYLFGRTNKTRSQVNSLTPFSFQRSPITDGSNETQGETLCYSLTLEIAYLLRIILRSVYY
jgi:hypothetical protein